jgi:hypothetical protein
LVAFVKHLKPFAILFTFQVDAHVLDLVHLIGIIERIFELGALNKTIQCRLYVALFVIKQVVQLLYAALMIQGVYPFGSGFNFLQVLLSLLILN